MIQMEPGRIVAFEGPTGSGKSTLIRELRDNYPDHRFLQRIDGERYQSPGFGAFTSCAVEYTAVMSATMDWETTVICDRFLISRWIYQSLQEECIVSDWYTKMARSLRRMKSTAVDEATDRMGRGVYLQPQITINVILPSRADLAARREASGKEYPYHLSSELMLYANFTEYLLLHPLPGVEIVTYS